MSNNDEDYNVRAEIQKVLTKIDDDMNKLKSELSSLNSFVDKNSTLPTTVKLVNQNLMTAAKEIGVNLENITEIEDSDEEDQIEGGADLSQSNSGSSSTAANASSVVAAANELAENMKSVLK